MTQILGLTPGLTYTPELVAKRPFQHLTLVCDQDHDGSHIAGLVVNWLHDRFPSLLQAKPNFVERFYTAIVKATPKRGGGEDLFFYTLPQYEAWIETLPEGGLKAYTVKYFKGLGTSTSSDARGYFTRMKSEGKHLFPYLYNGAADDEAMINCFGPLPEHVEARRRMLADYDGKLDYMDYSDPAGASLEAVVKNDMTPFMHYDNARAIPGPDGLKPSQRKVLYYFMSKNVTSEVKVAQAGASVAEYTHYHHGEDAIIETIVKLAQEHVGSNNVAYLVPEGQFGSRAQSRKEHAAARYIFTRLNPILRYIFPSEDDVILARVVDEGKVVEPEFYVGVVPPILLNGADGTGTGYKALWPSYNPGAVIDCCLQMAEAGLTGGLDAALAAELPPLEPWFAGFKGKTWVEDGTVFTRGSYELDLETNRLIITELPPGKWTDDVVAHIRERHMVVKEAAATKKRKSPDSSPDAAAGGRSKTPLVTDIFDGSSEHAVRIEVEVDPERLEAMDEEPDIVYATFGDLLAKMPLTTMNIFGATGALVKFSHPHEVIRSHCELRFDAYRRRKAHQIDEKKMLLAELEEKLRFVALVVSGELKISGRPLEDVAASLEGLDFPRRNGAYEHLLRLPLASLTREKADALQGDCERVQAELSDLELSTEFGMWKRELGKLQGAYHIYGEERASRQGDVDATTKGRGRKRRVAKKKV